MTPSDTCSVTFRVMDKLYGLKAIIPDDELIIDKLSGKNNIKSNNMNINIKYEGGLLEPNLKVVLYRRTYNDIYDQDYVVVDITDYVIDDLTSYDDNIYNLLDNLAIDNNVRITFDSSLKTGTYKLELRLYDNDSYVGNVFKYLIIK